ncbi:MAG: hypothetical protein QM784_01540 [Polyangiaceae bacterium]
MAEHQQGDEEPAGGHERGQPRQAAVKRAADDVGDHRDGHPEDGIGEKVDHDG